MVFSVRVLNFQESHAQGEFRAESDPSRFSITSLTQSGVLTTQLRLTQGPENGLSRGLIPDRPLPALVHRELSLSHTHCLNTMAHAC
jgi:hypothetical protein